MKTYHLQLRAIEGDKSHRPADLINEMLLAAVEDDKTILSVELTIAERPRVRVLAVDSNAPKSVKLAFLDGTSGSVITVEEEQ